MQSLTIEQLRAAHRAGGVEDVTLQGEGRAFLVRVATRSGEDAVLTKARSTEPRRFGSPLAAMNALREIGISTGRFDATAYDAAEARLDDGNKGRADAMRAAHQAAAYTRWLAAEIQASIDDPRPSIPHEEVMAEMDVELAASAIPARKHRV